MIKTISVAPMMDCTDKHEIYFLSLISKNIHLYTEMIVANAIVRGDRNKLLSFKNVSNPVILQIGGSDPDQLAEACKISEDYGYKEINLNLGCPSKKVQKNKFGACLMQEPDLVGKCIEAMTKATKLPVTIKTRIGYNEIENFEFLKSFIQTTKNAGSKNFRIGTFITAPPIPIGAEIKPLMIPDSPFANKPIFISKFFSFSLRNSK